MKFLKFASIICLSTILMSEKIKGQEIWKQGCQSQNNSSVDLTNTPIEAQCGRRNFDPSDTLDSGKEFEKFII